MFRYPLVLISDQNMFMQKEALRDMVAAMQERPDTALVTQTPYCRDRGTGFSAALEQVGQGLLCVVYCSVELDHYVTVGNSRSSKRSKGIL